jgi:hypothetical protein
MTRGNLERDARADERRADDGQAGVRLDRDRQDRDRRHIDTLRTAGLREEVPLEAWLEVMIEHEIKGAR